MAEVMTRISEQPNPDRTANMGTQDAWLPPDGASLRGKKRFASVAMRVLTQVVGSRMGIESEEGADGKRQDETDHSVAQKKVDNIKKVKATGRKPKQTFANIAALVNMRRKLPGGSGEKNKSTKTVQPPPEVVEEPVELPAFPRFSATLSPEAQYAMMKCYEDLLVDNINSNFPEERQVLPRSETPVMGYLREPFGEPKAQDDHSTNASHDKPVPPLWSNTTDVTPRKEHDSAATKEKQLKLTDRFERAMDILDSIHESQGHLVTSRRFKSREVKPVQNYNVWSKTWSKEFAINPPNK